MTSTASPRSPLDRYEADLAAGEIVADDAQRAAVEAIERVYRDLLASHGESGGGLLGRVLGRRVPRWTPVRGLYLWGSVGRGKTYIVDAFFDALPFAEKRRIHFHSFMRRTHDALKTLERESDPLVTVAGSWAREHRVLCLDEFHVGDITDAMLLANLLEALFADGVAVVCTSNEAPDDLYRGGLQRERFLPAIDLLKQHLDVLELSGTLDYRLRALERAPVYYVGPPGAHDDALGKAFRAIAPEAGSAGAEVDIEGRRIPTVRLADGVAWFTFDVLCRGARSTVDYIEIARVHHTVVLSDVPRLGGDDADAARRFINFVDEAYDRNVNLVLSAAAEPESIYTGQRLAQPFRRTASRLHEMRSHDYLARPHISD